jgi:8-amino-7-oxononanoate synthase
MAVNEPLDGRDAIQEWLVATMADLLKCPPSEVDPDARFDRLGIDSLSMVALSGDLEDRLGLRLRPTVLWDYPTVTALAAHLASLPRVEEAPPGGGGSEDWRLEASPEYGRFRAQLDALQAAGNPYFRLHEGAAGARVHIDGREYVNFASYNYLGLSGHPAVTGAARDALERHGTSASASRLVSGERPPHRELEAALAGLIGTGDAITFVSGHATAVSVIGHLLGPGDLVLHDEWIHNCALQGALLSGAHRLAFPHGDAAAAGRLLEERRAQHRRVLLVVEGVYSTDGDIADLPAFASLRRRHRAMLMVDEAHSIGVLGERGGGIREHFGLPAGEVDLWMGTLSKALASCGGYVAGTRALVEYLRYTCPGFVFSAAMPPASAAAARAAIDVLRAEPERVTRLRARGALFLALARERGLDTGRSEGTPVIPVMVGDSAAALSLARRLLERGIDAQPLVSPSVPDDAARLRFFVCSEHSEDDVARAVSATASLLASSAPRS